MTLDYIYILLGDVLHATLRLWEGRKSGQLCGQVVEFISDDGNRRNEIFEKKIHAKEVSHDRDKPLMD